MGLIEGRCEVFEGLYVRLLLWVFFCLFVFLMWTVFRVFIEFVSILFLFYALVFLATRGTWNLSSLTRDWTHTFCIRRRSLNHWIARDIPRFSLSLGGLSCVLFPLEEWLAAFPDNEPAASRLCRLKPLYCTCALKVSRGLSTLGKAMRGTPRGSSGLGLEGDPCVPLKLWTTHIPCGMRGKKMRVRLQPSMPGYLCGWPACPWECHCTVTFEPMGRDHGKTWGMGQASTAEHIWGAEEASVWSPDGQGYSIYPHWTCFLTCKNGNNTRLVDLHLKDMTHVNHLIVTANIYWGPLMYLALSEGFYLISFDHLTTQHSYKGGTVILSNLDKEVQRI